MKKRIIKSLKAGLTLSVISLSLISASSIFAQEPIPMGPGPVTAISPAPANPNNESAPIIPQGPGPVIAENGQPVGTPPPTTPPPPPGWGCAGCLSIPPNADWQNQGTMNVMATGYDSQGVEKQIPLFISYQFNGVQYNVTVLNAWNPYTYSWDANVDQPAYQTSYYFNGFTYNYYTVLSTGTFYFNL